MNKVLIDTNIYSMAMKGDREVTSNTADFYASILNSLREAGTPIPTNDIWIAAHVFQHGYVMMSKDKHFSKIPGLLHTAG